MSRLASLLHLAAMLLLSGGLGDVCPQRPGLRGSTKLHPTENTKLERDSSDFWLARGRS